MNEDRIGYRVRQALNHGLKDVPPTASRRLTAARHLALSRQKQPATVMVQATAGAGGRHAGNLGQHTPYLRQIMAVVALLLGMWLSFYWHSVQYVSELEQVDSALLADDLPPDAFLDDDFISWLTDDSPDE